VVGLLLRGMGRGIDHDHHLGGDVHGEVEMLVGLGVPKDGGWVMRCEMEEVEDGCRLDRRGIGILGL